ncbi:hypothetical protein [Priestia megaterium]|uniref:hypothetical protein n=1 Tax=Priestia megaterium TaxID=1404 RepID=UPI002E1B68D8|nr:hypothetical protein [Priestia megaterium]
MVRFFCYGERRFYLFRSFQQLIGGQGEDFCGNSGTGETPQERKQRGGSPTARGKRSLAWKSTAVSQAVHTGSFIPFVRLYIELISLYLNLSLVFVKKERSLS